MELLNFRGTIDWAVDLQEFNIADTIRPTGEYNKLSCINVLPGSQRSAIAYHLSSSLKSLRQTLFQLTTTLPLPHRSREWSTVSMTAVRRDQIVQILTAPVEATVLCLTVLVLVTVSAQRASGAEFAAVPTARSGASGKETTASPGADSQGPNATKAANAVVHTARREADASIHPPRTVARGGCTGTGCNIDCPGCDNRIVITVQPGGGNPPPQQSPHDGRPQFLQQGLPRVLRKFLPASCLSNQPSLSSPNAAPRPPTN